MTRARRTQIFLTGFGPFLPDAPHNPTQALVERLQLEGAASTTATAATAGDDGNIFCDHFEVADCRVVAVSTEAAVAAVSALKERMSSSEDGDDDTCRVLVHLGVHSTLRSFHLERCAYNEADFRIPDVAGRQLKKEVICVEDGGLEECVTTLLPLDAIAAKLAELGHPTEVSEDAGRFLCNYIYFHSLKLSAAVNGNKHGGRVNTTSLFVHVPPFTTIAQPEQEKFLKDLLTQIAAHDMNTESRSDDAAE